MSHSKRDVWFGQFWTFFKCTSVKQKKTSFFSSEIFWITASVKVSISGKPGLFDRPFETEREETKKVNTRFTKRELGKKRIPKSSFNSRKKYCGNDMEFWHYHSTVLQTIRFINAVIRILINNHQFQIISKEQWSKASGKKSILGRKQVWFLALHRPISSKSWKYLIDKIVCQGGLSLLYMFYRKVRVKFSAKWRKWFWLYYFCNFDLWH
jgi:hypothetical protein